MHSATMLSTRIDGDVTQTAYELSEPVTYTRWNGRKQRTNIIVVSHTRFDGANETMVFPGTYDGKIPSYTDLFVASPIMRDSEVLKALGYTLTI